MSETSNAFERFRFLGAADMKRKAASAAASSTASGLAIPHQAPPPTRGTWSPASSTPTPPVMGTRLPGSALPRAAPDLRASSPAASPPAPAAKRARRASALDFPSPCLSPYTTPSSTQPTPTAAPSTAAATTAGSASAPDGRSADPWVTDAPDCDLDFLNSAAAPAAAAAAAATTNTIATPTPAPAAPITPANNKPRTRARDPPPPAPPPPASQAGASAARVRAARAAAVASGPPRGVPEKLGDRPLRLIVVGHNPSAHAWQSGHYYSHPANHMWRVLIGTGIAPPGVRGAEDDDRLPGEAGVGFLDVGCGHPGTDSSSFKSHVFEAWSRAFYARLRAHMTRASASIGCTCGRCGAPSLVAFSGKRHYLELLNVGRAPRDRVKTVEHGPQLQLPTGWPFPAASTEVWVCSSTSGAAAMTRQQREEPWRRLAERMGRIEWPRRGVRGCGGGAGGGGGEAGGGGGGAGRGNGMESVAGGKVGAAAAAAAEAEEAEAAAVGLEAAGAGGREEVEEGDSSEGAEDEEEVEEMGAEMGAEG
ncbi:uracil DNA N-glycosylase Thp1 [Pleodorina starrii]|uniref:Uracil DNA N-glycosylase Thp1 n=1 Tax=Pleodorina starrii TaxID=330485 RepID=A0A9W6BG63_9CHLO|nr:uracil DNA N-glycosylase Thp1 [Pleodorina starrii]GLC51173.1 uracil DNA N-glycosylase Thp1 [Pleodorina starrii]GLC63531.1 uracil DNA N-glycosylase Thp1 [Pleodorina starrii]